MEGPGRSDVHTAAPVTAERWQCKLVAWLVLNPFAKRSLLTVCVCFLAIWGFSSLEAAASHCRARPSGKCIHTATSRKGGKGYCAGDPRENQNEPSVFAGPTSCLSDLGHEISKRHNQTGTLNGTFYPMKFKRFDLIRISLRFRQLNPAVSHFFIVFQNEIKCISHLLFLSKKKQDR